LYILGGDASHGSATGTTTVEWTKTNPDSSLSGWQATSPMTTPRLRFGAVSVGSYLYAVGGAQLFPSPILSSAERAVIQPDGSLGTWELTSSLTMPRVDLAVVAVGGYIYALGGYKSFESTSSVERAVIQTDGSLGAWEVISNMTVARQSFAAVAAGGYIYAIGGINTTSVERAAVQPDGSLGPWQFTSSLVKERQGLAAVVAGNYIYALGGSPNISVPSPIGRSVERAHIDVDRSLEPWEESSEMVLSRTWGAALVDQHHIYMLGGFPDRCIALPCIEQTDVERALYQPWHIYVAP
jgi:hypothetical protein